jgi:hypothetical protein
MGSFGEAAGGAGDKDGFGFFSLRKSNGRSPIHFAQGRLFGDDNQKSKDEYGGFSTALLTKYVSSFGRNDDVYFVGKRTSNDNRRSFDFAQDDKLFGFVLSQVSNAGPPPQRRRPIAGDPGRPGAPMFSGAAHG